jgi:hypothetical protein
MFNKKFIFVGLIFLIVACLAVSFINADEPVTVTITDIRENGTDLIVDGTFYINNNSSTPYTGNVALYSTCPPGYQPGTVSWNWIGPTQSGNVSFVIKDRSIADYDSITIMTEPDTQFNDSWNATNPWVSPLDNTTVNQSITNNSDGGIDLNVTVSNISNDTDIPIVVVKNDSEGSNSTNISVPIVNGTGSIVIPINNSNLNNGTSIQVIVNGKSNGNFADGFTGYKSSKSKPYIHIINNRHSNNHSVGLLKTGNYIPGILVLLMILVIIVTLSKRKD